MNFNILCSPKLVVFVVLYVFAKSFPSQLYNRVFPQECEVTYLTIMTYCNLDTLNKNKLLSMESTLEIISI